MARPAGFLLLAFLSFYRIIHDSKVEGIGGYFLLLRSVTGVAGQVTFSIGKWKRYWPVICHDITDISNR